MRDERNRESRVRLEIPDTSYLEFWNDGCFRVFSSFDGYFKVYIKVIHDKSISRKNRCNRKIK